MCAFTSLTSLQYDENAEVQAYFKSRLDVIRQSMSVFDLGAILIKPVQRILKYPLLLNELIKVIARADDVTGIDTQVTVIG